MQALIAWDLIGDFRAPDILHQVLASEAWRDDAFQSRATVT